MVKKAYIVDPSCYDLDKPVADIDEIRRYNKQRFEIEQLTAIVYENIEDYACIGYKELTPNEFWVRGHMPQYPLMPGVIMCEVAAQVSSYFSSKYNLMGNNITMGFAGLDNVRFRGIVLPEKRLVMQVKMIKCRKILLTAQFMGIVDGDIVCEGIVKGVPLDIP
ncbi:MAG: beta-hydroxyacyl-ACP dehydratase [Planctomycetaceae bacterium]|nr:beta-hydroxyacyl-ACP dehydratase [Planctomycetaceae bacterium]